MIQASDSLWTLLQLVKDTGSPAQKLQLLKEYRDTSADCHDGLRHLFKLVFDPRLTFGVAKKLPALTGSGVLMFTAGTLDVLHGLAVRQLTGKAAQEAIAKELEALSPASGSLLVAILQQNLRAGFGADVANELFPGLIPTFKPCLSHKFHDHKHKVKWEEGVSGELKLDGVRGFSFLDQGGFCSRKGLPLNSGPALDEQATEFLKVWRSVFNLGGDYPLLDGEMGTLNGVFRDTMSQVRSSQRVADGVRIGVIDVLRRSEFDAGRSELAYIQRRERMEEFFDKHGGNFPLVGLVQRFPLTCEQDVLDKFADLLNADEEGLIVKPHGGHWEGKRSYSWLKVKAENEVDATIVEVLPGDPLSDLADTCGAVQVRLPGGVLCKVAGMTRAMRDYLWANRDTVIGMTVEVHFHEYTPDGSLRHPRLHLLRDDK